MSWRYEYGVMVHNDEEQYFKRNIFYERGDTKALENFRTKYNNIDLYKSIFTYEDCSDVDNCKVKGNWCFDLDRQLTSEEEYGKLIKDLTFLMTTLQYVFYIPKDYIKLYFSGSKGFHVIIDSIIFGSPEHTKLQDYYRYFAQIVNGYLLYRSLDFHIYSKKSLYRIPNSINYKSGCYKVPVDFDFVKGATLSDIKEYASKCRIIPYKVPKYIYKTAKVLQELSEQYDNENKTGGKNRMKGDTSMSGKGELLPCVTELMNSSVDEGNRNNAAIALASALFQSNLKFDKVLDRVVNWNGNNNKPLPVKEIVNTVKSASKQNENGHKYGCNNMKELGFCTGKCRLLDNICH